MHQWLLYSSPPCGPMAWTLTPVKTWAFFRMLYRLDCALDFENEMINDCNKSFPISGLYPSQIHTPHVLQNSHSKLKSSSTSIPVKKSFVWSLIHNTWWHARSHAMYQWYISFSLWSFQLCLERDINEMIQNIISHFLLLFVESEWSS